jgi:hypothetical protein
MGEGERIGRRTAILAAWADADRARAVLPADREIIEASASLRELIVDVLMARGHLDELYDACSMLGRLIASRGGSPTFASATLDGASEALSAKDGAKDAPWLVAARATVVESFSAALAENARREADQGWEFPSCAVPLGQAAVAIAAGLPSDDDEQIAAWAARVAKAAALSGVRRAVVSGSERACAALLDAFALVGVEANETPQRLLSS